jgi:peptidoglycan hydrolase-like protein with peptidoglycan-binding domain
VGDFAATLQRALAARGYYDGPVTGVIDAETTRAIRAYQAPLGIDSATLSLAAARRLGLAPIARDGT